MWNSLVNLALLVALMTMEASAQTSGNWKLQIPQRFPQAPGLLAYDSARSQMVLYTGANDIWLWDGSNWTQKFPQTTPPARGGYAMAYDAARSQIILFGGTDDLGLLNDTWVWDGINWSPKFPQSSPSPRTGHGMAYDAARSQIMLFGGFAEGLGTTDVTWVWDGTNWTQKFPPVRPSPRDNFAMAYDSARAQVVLFGGVFATSSDAMWVWDGTTWAQRSSSISPSTRVGAAMAFDASRGQLILFGGAAQPNDTWAWDGARWTLQLPTSSPSERSSLALAYDTAHTQIVLFGGRNRFGVRLTDTWTWTSASTGTPPLIDHAITAGAYGAFTDAAPGSWIEIYGSNLSNTTRTWTAADFIGNTAPTSLDGVQVTIGGQKAAVYYIQSNPAQVSAQVPSNVATGGPVPLTVTNGGLTSAPINVTLKATDPGMLAPPSFSIGGKQYVVALLPDNVTYILPPGVIPGVPARQARPGDTITMYGVGFGGVNPAFSAGQVVTQSNQLALTFQILFGQTAALVQYAGLAPGAVGLYQFNVVVPAVADNDLVPLGFVLGGVASTQTLYIAVHR